MIVTAAKMIRVESGGYTFDRDGETPGRVLVTHFASGGMALPGNPEDAQRFVAAYLRAVAGGCWVSRKWV